MTRFLFCIKKTVGVYLLKSFVRTFYDFIASIFNLFVVPSRNKLPIIDDHNLITPAIKLSQQIKSRHISCEEVVDSFISRIKTINPIINAVVDKRFNQALREARIIDRKIEDALDGEGDTAILDLPLLGVPVSIKEIIAVDDCSYTGGIVKRKSVKAHRNAEAVDNLIKSGLIPVAMTNVPEMAVWWDSDNPLYGRTVNPYDLSRIAGGSTGGEAALISAAGSLVGLGSDFAGSIRLPANFCGIFGHKTSPYIVPNDGMYPSVKGEREKLLAFGPLTRYASDLRPMLKVLAGKKAARLRLDEPVDLTKIKLFWCEDILDIMANKTQNEILEKIREAKDHFANKYNVVVEKVTFDEFRYGFFLWAVEANVIEAPKIAFYFKDGKEDMNVYKETLKRICKLSEHQLNGIFATYVERVAPAYGTSKHSYLMQKSKKLRQKFNDLIGDNGVLFMPTHPEAAPSHHVTVFKAFNLSYTALTSTLQAPITQCPLGLTKDGLPVGMQIISKQLNDRLTIAVAEELEKVFGGWISPCRIAVD